ncbi:MAG: DUF559 domain-containing protein [Anaerolineae bacterium]|nr:endonuclease domain-containing protein [Anaerolineae bacterium]
MERKWRPDLKLWAKLKPIAREMRHEPTLAEQKLWALLRSRQLEDLKFRRQHPVERFIADFCCVSRKLIIEVDGEIHQYTQEEDAVRTEVLGSHGFTILRFSNDQVLKQPELVLATILDHI